MDDSYNDSPRSSVSLTSPFNIIGSTKDTNQNIKVICRFRPENEIELNKGQYIVELPNNKSVIVNNRDLFTFDRIFEPTTSQTEVYQFSISQTVDDLLNGYNGTVLAYGQTGSGKSYTMMGPPESNNIDETGGMIPRIAADIFERIESGSSDIEYTVGVQFMEIYLEQIKDLIDINNNGALLELKFAILEDKTNGIYVKGLAQAFVSSVDELFDILTEGLKVRTSISTNMNAESSRSHAIFQINLTQKHLTTGLIKKSHLFLVDLAGSEKVDKTGAQGQTLEEAKKINSSLSSLGNVIYALTDGKSTHVPYRDSKLTRILQESLGGNSRTSLIINCSPSSLNEVETLSTLRFGTRAKKIENTAHINTELSASSLRSKITQLEKINENNQAYIKELEMELSQWRSGDKLHLSMSSIPTVRNSMIVMGTPKTPQKEFASRLPVPVSSSPLLPMKANQMNEELERRDFKISELENTLLAMKMNNLKSNHTEESKLFHLENSLYKLNNKLNDVELINNNLRKHLLISEKIIESRDIKINKLKVSLKEQQLLISKETLQFKSKLGEIQDKLDVFNKDKHAELLKEARESLIRESIYSLEGSRTRDSLLFHLENRTKDTLLEEHNKYTSTKDAGHSFDGLHLDDNTDNESSRISDQSVNILGDIMENLKNSDDATPEFNPKTPEKHDESKGRQRESILTQESQIPSSKLSSRLPSQIDDIRSREVEDLPECDIEEFNPVKSNDDSSSSVSDKKLRRISLIETKRSHRAALVDAKTFGHQVSLADQENQIVNFQQEYLSIGEFLKESRRRSTMEAPRAPRLADELDSSDTSGMFESPPSSPKPGLNLRIVKPLRGGGAKILHNTINLF